LGLARRATILSILLTALLGAATAQSAPPAMTMQQSEAMFSVMAAFNACGYDHDLADSLPVRAQIRDELTRSATSLDAQKAQERICRFFAEHKQPSASSDLAQYVSLSLFLGDGPVFESRVKDADLPPDAFRVLGLVPFLQNFYITTDLHKIWLRHQSDYETIFDAQRAQINQTFYETDNYLRRPQSGYLGGSFTLYLEPQIPPKQTNSRHYGEDFFSVFSPGPNGAPMDQIRHTYLHFILGPLNQHRGSSLLKLMPLLESVKTAPMASVYKSDIAALTTESLIRAVEAHLKGGLDGDAQAKQAYVELSMREGYVMTAYFFDQLTKFRKDDVGLERAYPDWIYYMDVGKLQKQIARMDFAPAASPELVSVSEHKVSMTTLAMRALSAGNPDSALRFAQLALDRNEEAGPARFTLARAHIMKGHLPESQQNFELALKLSKDNQTIAWSHIYLGRILDLLSSGKDYNAEDYRKKAIEQYMQALVVFPPEDASKQAKDVRAAAQKGVDAPFKPARKAQ